MPVKPRFLAACPMLLTMLVLCVMIYAVSGFRRPVVRIDRIDAEGTPPVLRYGREYRVEGILEDADNPYREVQGLSLQLVYGTGKGTFGIGFGNADRSHFDLVHKRFTVPLRVFPGSAPVDATLKIRINDRSGRQYEDMPGCSLRVRVE